MNALEHLEKFLGPVQQGWGSTEGSAGVQVCLFQGQPFDGAVTYATVGLSDHVLFMKERRPVRQELVFSVHERHAGDDWPSLLFFLSERLLREHRALLRGDVVPLGAPLRPGSGSQWLYTSLPILYGDGFSTLEDTEPATVFAWLFPINKSEMAEMAKRGWDAFEDTLERENPDLLDIMR
jgi:hypothetical protein